MPPDNELKKKAEQLIHTINFQAISSYDAFLTRFPEIEKMMVNRTTDDWVFYMTVGGTAAAVMMSHELTGKESTEIVRSLSNWNGDAKEALDNLLGFIDQSAKSGIDHFWSLGIWVLKNITEERQSTEDSMLTSTLGVFLRDSFKDIWGTI